VDAELEDPFQQGKKRVEGNGEKTLLKEQNLPEKEK